MDNKCVVCFFTVGCGRSSDSSFGDNVSGLHFHLRSRGTALSPLALKIVGITFFIVLFYIRGP